MNTLLPSLKAQRVAPPRVQRGLTLIELMVSLVIGLVLAIVASSTYLYSKQAYNAVSETSQLEENGRLALNLLARNIQSAGYVAINPKSNFAQAPTDLKIRGCDFGMTNPKSATSSTDLACLSSAPAGATLSASIGIFYETDASNTTTGKFQGFDCLGNAPVTIASTTGGSNTYQVRSYFFISTSTAQTPYGSTTMGQLSCVTDPTTATGATATFQAQPLIPGIHQLRVNYLTASGLDNTTAQKSNNATTLETAGTWKNVTAVELCVLTKSIQATGNDTATQATDCYGTSFTPPPSQSFRKFTSVVNLRNRTPS